MRKFLVQGLVFDAVPAAADAEPEAVVREHRQLRRLLGGQRGLALGQDQHGGGQSQRGGHACDVTEGDEDLVEGVPVGVWAGQLVNARVGAEHVVVDQQMLEAHRFDGLRVVADCAGVIADFIGGQHRAQGQIDSHVVLFSGSGWLSAE